MIEEGKIKAGESKISQARIFKRILELVGEADNEERNIELETCKHILEWATSENKKFLIEKL